MYSLSLDERPPISTFLSPSAQWLGSVVGFATGDAGTSDGKQDAPISSPKKARILITVFFSVGLLCVILMVPVWFCLSRHVVRQALRNFFSRHPRTLPVRHSGSVSSIERRPHSKFSCRRFFSCCLVESDFEMENEEHIIQRTEVGSASTTDGSFGLDKVKNRHVGGGVAIGEGGGGAKGGGELIPVEAGDGVLTKEFSCPVTTDAPLQAAPTVSELLDQIANVEKYLEELLPYYVQAESLTGLRSNPNSDQSVVPYYVPPPASWKSVSTRRSSMSGGSTSWVRRGAGGGGGGGGGGGVSLHVEDHPEEGFRNRLTLFPGVDQECGEWLASSSSRRMMEEGGSGGGTLTMMGGSTGMLPPEDRSSRSVSPLPNVFFGAPRSPSPFANMCEVPVVRQSVHPSSSAPMQRLSPSPLPRSTTPLLPARGGGTFSAPIPCAFDSSVFMEGSFQHSFRTPPTSRRRYHAQTPPQDRSGRPRSRSVGRRGGGGGGGEEDTDEKVNRLGVPNPLSTVVHATASSHATHSSTETTPLSGQNSSASSRYPFSSLVSGSTHQSSTKGLLTQRKSSVRVPPSASKNSGLAIVEGSAVVSESGLSQELLLPFAPTASPFASPSGVSLGSGGGGTLSLPVSVRSTATTTTATTNPMGEAAAATALMYLNWRAQCETMPSLPEKKVQDAEGKEEVGKEEPGQK